MRKQLLTVVFICFLIAVCLEIRGNDKFSKNNINDAITAIVRMRSNEKLNSSERIKDK